MSLKTCVEGARKKDDVIHLRSIELDEIWKSSKSQVKVAVVAIVEETSTLWLFSKQPL